MNLFINFIPITQTPDSTQTGQSFIQQNDQDFMGQQSIMSAEFKNNSIDSIVKVKTKKLRRHKKVVKSYKYLDSYLIVKKDSFAFLQNIQNPQATIFNINSYLYQNPLIEPIQIFKKDSIVKIDSIENEQAFWYTTVDSTTIKDSSIISKTEISNISYLSKSNQDSTVTQTENTITVSKEIPELSIKTENKTTNSLNGDIWLMGILFGVLFLFAFTKMQFNSKLRIYYQSLFSYQFFYKMYKEQNTTTQRTGFLLSSIFYINLSLIIFYSIRNLSYLNLSSKHFLLFSQIFGILLITVLIFTILNKLLSFIFESYDVIHEYLYNIYFFNRLLGLSLLPLVIIYPYLSPSIAPYALYFAISFISLSFILRWFRGLQISIKFRISYFYIFLYLCILEIIPLFFIFKMI